MELIRGEWVRDRGEKIEREHEDPELAAKDDKLREERAENTAPRVIVALIITQISRSIVRHGIDEDHDGEDQTEEADKEEDDRWVSSPGIDLEIRQTGEKTRDEREQTSREQEAIDRIMEEKSHKKDKNQEKWTKKRHHERERHPERLPADEVTEVDDICVLREFLHALIIEKARGSK